MADTRILFIDEKALKDSGYIDPNVNGNILSMAIKVSQDTIIRECIGKPLFESLKNMIQTGEIYSPDNLNYKYLLDNYIHDALIFGVLYEIDIELSNKIRNKGNIQTYGDNISNASKDDLIYTDERHANRASIYRLELCRYLHENRELFPELNSGCGCGLRRFSSCYHSNFYFEKKCCRR